MDNIDVPNSKLPCCWLCNAIMDFIQFTVITWSESLQKMARRWGFCCSCHLCFGSAGQKAIRIKRISRTHNNAYWSQIQSPLNIFYGFEESLWRCHWRAERMSTDVFTGQQVYQGALPSLNLRCQSKWQRRFKEASLNASYKPQKASERKFFKHSDRFLVFCY